MARPPEHSLFPVVIIALGLNCPIAMFIFGFDKPEVVKAGCALSAILKKEVVICLLLHRGSGPPVPPLGVQPRVGGLGVLAVFLRGSVRRSGIFRSFLAE